MVTAKMMLLNPLSLWLLLAFFLCAHLIFPSFALVPAVVPTTTAAHMSLPGPAATLLSNSTHHHVITVPSEMALVKSTGEYVSGACRISTTAENITCISAQEFANMLDAQNRHPPTPGVNTTDVSLLESFTSTLNNSTESNLPLSKRGLRSWITNPWRGNNYFGPGMAVGPLIDCSNSPDLPCTASATWTETYTATITVGINFGISASEVWRLTGFTAEFTESWSSSAAHTVTFDIRGIKGQVFWQPTLFDYGGQLWRDGRAFGHGIPSRLLGAVQATAPVKPEGFLYCKSDTNPSIRDATGWHHIDRRDVPGRFDAGVSGWVFTPRQCAQMAVARDKNLAIWRAKYNACWYKDVHWAGANTFNMWGDHIGRYDIPGYDRWLPGSNSWDERQRWVRDQACDVIAHGNDGRFYCKQFAYCDDCVMMLRRNR